MSRTKAKLPFLLTGEPNKVNFMNSRLERRDNDSEGEMQFVQKAKKRLFTESGATFPSNTEPLVLYLGLNYSTGAPQPPPRRK